MTHHWIPVTGETAWVCTRCCGYTQAPIFANAVVPCLPREEPSDAVVVERFLASLDSR